MSDCIKLSYGLAKVSLPPKTMAQSTRAQATWSAFLSNIPIADTCKAATWCFFQPLCHQSSLSWQCQLWEISVTVSVQIIPSPFNCKGTADELPTAKCAQSLDVEKMVTYLCRNHYSLRCVVHVYLTTLLPSPILWILHTVEVKERRERQRTDPFYALIWEHEESRGPYAT